MVKKKMSFNEAKELFFSSDCSTFIMARENLPEYKRYIELNIPKEMEQEWREVKILEYYMAFKNGSFKEPTWILIDKMSELVVYIKSAQSLEKIFETIKSAMNNLNDKERVIISETINGRKHISLRSGLIYLSFDIGEISLAKQFSSLSLELANLTTNNIDLLNRADNSKQLCNQIVDELFNQERK